MPLRNILPLKEGSKVTLYDVAESRRYRKPTSLFITYRGEDKVKKVHQITSPKMEIYFTKPEYRTFHTAREYIKFNKIYPVQVTQKNVLPTIKKEIFADKNPVSVGYQNLINTLEQSHATYQSMKQILHWPFVHMADLDLETYYWIQLGYHYNTDNLHIIDKCFGDIENDIYGLTSADTANNLDPVNACTLIFEFDPKGLNGKKNIQVYTFLLRNYKRYPQQKSFEENLDRFYAECHEKFDHQTVMKKGKKKVIDTYADYHIVFFDHEDELLYNIFRTINHYKPDTCAFWNMPYDMPKMKARMERLNMDPATYMCDRSMYPKDQLFLEFHMDDRAIDIAERNSYIKMASTTKYIDQMQHYASIRKGQKAYGSNALDNIANLELGMGKWKFQKGVNVTNAAILDYWNFVLYNIRDVWCQVLIDQTTTDIMGLIYDMNQMNCPLHHLAKQTRYQRYIHYCRYLRKGYVPGNNINIDYSKVYTKQSVIELEKYRQRQKDRQRLDYQQTHTKPAVNPFLTQIDSSGDDTGTWMVVEDSDVLDEDGNVISSSDLLNETVDRMRKEEADIYRDSIKRKIMIQGGVVGNPNNNIANGEVLIPGIHSKHVYHDLIDMDFSSEYPYVKLTRSVSRSSQFGRLIIPERISKYQNMLPLGLQKRKKDINLYIPGAEFTSDYLSQDYFSFGTCWFNLPFVDECANLMEQMLLGEDPWKNKNKSTKRRETTQGGAVRLWS